MHKYYLNCKRKAENLLFFTKKFIKSQKKFISTIIYQNSTKTIGYTYIYCLDPQACTSIILPAFSARTFPTLITSVVQDLNEKITGVDCMMRWLSIALHIS
jgi:hypothetical protein